MSFLLRVWPTLVSNQYALFCFDGVLLPFSLASTFWLKSNKILQGNFANGVLMLVSSVAPAYSKPETNARRWPVPVPTMRVALLRVLALIRRTAGVIGGGNGVPTAGVVGLGMQLVAVALAQGRTGPAACAITSSLFQLR